ncbi:hypothetical protein J3459_018380 [Metarhizium acridum]|nr:hypothetical protein J3459_018380 [Metarhizium acridum]
MKTNSTLGHLGNILPTSGNRLSKSLLTHWQWRITTARPVISALLLLHRQPAAMTATQSSRSPRTKSTDPTSILPTSATTKTKKSTPYNHDFDLHLADHRDHPIYSSQEPDLEGVMNALFQRATTSRTSWRTGRSR